MSDKDFITVTFRITPSLKKLVEDAAHKRGMTTTRFIVESLQNEVDDKPPRWFTNWMASRGSRGL